MTKSEAKQGSRNPAWKGDAVSYSALHAWVYKQLPRPLACPKCGAAGRIEACNISGTYKRDVADWEYLCRKCHMEKDGRNDQLRASGKSRKLPEPNCLFCGKPVYRKSKMRTAKFCNRACLSAAGGPKGYKRDLLPQ